MSSTGDPTKRVNCSEWLANALADAGVTHVYGGHGGALVPLVNAIVRNPRLTWVPTRNEANASLMAAAHSKLTGCLGCCIATSGPGATNLTTGLLDADQDQCAVLAVTGLKPRAGLSYSEFQDLPQSRMFAAAGLQFSVDVASPEAFVPILRDAVSKALTARICVHLGVPVDVQAAECPVPLKPFCAAHAHDRLTFPSLDQRVIADVASELLLLSSPRPGRILIAVGHRCVEAGPDILRLAERLHAPILTRLDAKGCCDEMHPLVWGVIGVHGKPGLEMSAKFVETAELVLSFGVHDDTLLLCNRAGLQIRPMIQFEPDAVCLLHNARFRALHTVIGDPSAAISKLLELLDPQSKHPLPETISQVRAWGSGVSESGIDREGPLAKRHKASPEGENVGVPLWDQVTSGKWQGLKDEKCFNRLGRFEIQNTQCKYCHPGLVVKEVSRHMQSEDVLCVDTGDVTLWASLCAVLRYGQRTLSSERLGTMGYGLCAGLVASLVRAGAGRAVVIAGDGGLQMSVNELGTVKQLFAASTHELKLLVVVFDNSLLGRVIFGFDGALGCELGPSPDFVGLARSYGGEGELLTSQEQLPGVMARAFASKGLYVVHAMTDPELKADMVNFTDTSTTMMNSG